MTDAPIPRKLVDGWAVYDLRPDAPEVHVLPVDELDAHRQHGCPCVPVREPQPNGCTVVVHERTVS